MAKNTSQSKNVAKEPQNSGPTEIILRFEAVSFSYGHNHHILEKVDISLRRGMQVPVMGQNGAGKSTIFKIISGVLKAEEGIVQKNPKLTIATASQSMSPEDRERSVRQYFEKCFKEKVYDLDPRIDTVLNIVNLHAPHDRIIKTFSGGQQARLLLASALIQNPDLLLLDEPTNNLDKAGILHLTEFLKNYPKTCVVISHDAEFLNSFTKGVLYLDVFTKKVEQYAGNYYDLLAEISARIERENRKNAQLAKKIQENKDKVNFFAQKGGKMRNVAQKMREKIEEMEEDKVEVRKEDKTIRNFTIPAQEIIGEVVHISSFTTIDLKTHKPKERKVNISLKKKMHLRLSGPNGIGKSTLLETLAQWGQKSERKEVVVAPGVRIGYYRQDFSTLNFEDTVRDTLARVMEKEVEQTLRATAAGFLIGPEMMGKKIGMLSEGQKGLVAFAQLALLRPGLLILDEPTNHINFRHLPIIAKALDQYEGAMILVSHVPDFVEQIRIDETLDLGK